MLGHSPASAQTAGPAYMTVDEVQVALGGVEVTGVIQGEATPTTRAFHGGPGTDAALRAVALEQCHRMLLLALAKPGPIPPPTSCFELFGLL